VSRKIAPVYGVWGHEMTIAAPIDVVWRHVLDYASWQNFPVCKNVSGKSGEEGEVVMLRKEEQGFEFPPYYAITVRKDAPHRIIWKTWPEKGAHEVDFFGIVDFRLAEVAGGTRFSNSLIYEFLVPYQNESELEDYRTQQDRNFRNLMAATLPKLKVLCEQRL
jgi:hypothetical protein